MPGRAVTRPRPLSTPTVPSVDDNATARALDALADAANAPDGAKDVVRVDLVGGRNAVRHGLGRVPRFVAVMPSVADASFAYGVVAKNPHADRQVLIDVVGIAQPGASVLVM